MTLEEATAQWRQENPRQEGESAEAYEVRVADMGYLFYERLGRDAVEQAHQEEKDSLGEVLMTRCTELLRDATFLEDTKFTPTTLQMRQALARTDRAIVDLVKLLVRLQILDPTLEV